MENFSSNCRIAIFASGAGSNAVNIIRYFRGEPCGAEVALVVCDRPGAGVLMRAAELGVETCVLSPAELREPHILLPLMERYGIGVIVLAGFLRMIPPFLIARYAGRIVNIHPSLLPAFGGKGMYGHHVHEAVIAAGERRSGITIHQVSEQCDGGQILFQADVAVEEDDTPASLEAKIHALEYRHYPLVIHRLIDAARADGEL